ncbi:phage regulatory CII family protein [Sphingobium sp. MI1205]|uniref:phage regulatory CII family protein n=1 Tax=Sphingobium sp. MI1205 TaxID=407020 RepID=UPI00077043B4|nr:phage regulatory CII family protein [Sphingobium sp. MI1205]AMK18727.1 hypothetical protein K663_11740 [Sphingobium sp. MI1205]
MTNGVTLSTDQLYLKKETRAAVDDVQGMDKVAKMLGRSQSRISHYCSSNRDEFMPIDLVAELEQLTVGKPGHPRITRALARQAGFLLVPEGGEKGEGRSLSEHLADVVGEAAGVMTAMKAAITGCALDRNARREALQEARELQDAAAELVAALEAQGG